MLTVDEGAVLAEAREAWERRKAETPPIDQAARRYLAAQERLMQWARNSEFAVDRM